jgi:tetratricopeptide (TPR) repeat protein
MAKLLMGRMAEAREAADEAFALRQRLYRANPAAISSRQQMAAGYDLVATLQNLAGQNEEALANYQEAQQLAESVVQENPTNHVLRYDLARSYYNAARVRRQLGQRDIALHLLEQTTSHLQRLIAEQPESARYKTLMARTYGTLAIWHMDSDPAKALAFYRQARDVSEQLTHEHPRNPEHRRDLAQTFVNMGTQYVQMLKPAEAFRSYQEAQTIQEQVARDFLYPELEKDRAINFTNIGVLHRDAGKLDEAQASFHQAQAICDNLLKKNPDQLAGRSTLGMTLHEWGRALWQRHRYEEALAFYQKGIIEQRKAFDKSKHVSFRELLLRQYLDQAAVLRDLKRNTEAEAALTEFTKLAERQPEVLYLVAREFALRVAVMKDGPVNDPALRQRYTEQAFRALQEAVAQGFQDAKRLKQEPVFQPLGAEGGFQRLLKQLESKAKSGK